MNTQRGQAGEVCEQRRSLCVGRVATGQVGIRLLACLRDREVGIGLGAGSPAGARQRQVGHRRQRDDGRGLGAARTLARQVRCERQRQATACGIADDGQRPQATRGERVPACPHVHLGHREGVLGCESIVRREGRNPGAGGDVADKMPVRGGRAPGVPPSVEIEDGTGGGWLGRPAPPTRDATDRVGLVANAVGRRHVAHDVVEGLPRGRAAKLSLHRRSESARGGGDRCIGRRDRVQGDEVLARRGEVDGVRKVGVHVISFAWKR